MKIFFVFLCVLFLSVFFSCKKNNVERPADMAPPIDTFIRNNFYKDAVELYLREIYGDSTHKNYNDPVLDTTEINKIMQIIQAVYYNTSAESDTVFNIYKIHAGYCTISKGITVWAWVDSPETIQLSNGIIPTGNDSLDNILTTYKFDSVYRPSYYPEWTSALTLYTDKYYNLLAIKTRLENTPPVFSAEISNGCFGDPSTSIGLGRNADSARISFYIGWGDCPSGCIHSKGWVFEVKDDIAQFIKTIER